MNSPAAGCAECGGMSNMRLKLEETKNAREALEYIWNAFDMLKQKEGVVEAKVSYPDGKGKVIYDASRIHKEEIVAAIR